MGDNAKAETFIGKTGILGLTQAAGAVNVAISIAAAATSFYSLTLVAQTFGGSVGSDAYFFLASFCALVTGMMGGILSVVFVPVFVKLLTTSSNSEAEEFASSILSWYLMFGLVLSVPALIWSEQLLSMVSQFGADQIPRVNQVFRYFGLIFCVGLITEVFRSIALGVGRFAAAAISVLLPPVFLILSIVCVGAVLAEEALALSLLFAKITTLIFLMAVVSRSGIRARINLKQNDNTNNFLRTAMPYWLAGTVTYLANFYFDYRGSGLGTGVVTGLAYANKIFTLPTAVFLLPLLEILRTQFARLQSSADTDAFNEKYNSFMGLAIGFSIPVAACFFLFSQEIVSALFQRGEFGATDVKMTANLLAVYSLALPFAATFQLNGRACESFQKLLWLSVAGMAINLIMIGATAVFSDTFGYTGIPMARVVVEIVLLLPFGFAAFHLLGGIPEWSGIIKCAATSSVSAASALFIVVGRVAPPYDGSAYSAIDLGISLAAFFSIYFAFLMGLNPRIAKEIKRTIRQATS